MIARILYVAIALVVLGAFPRDAFRGVASAPQAAGEGQVASSCRPAP